MLEFAPRRASGGPSWALALSLLGVSGVTYYYVLQRVGPNLVDQLEAEAAAQEAAERAAVAGAAKR